MKTYKTDWLSSKPVFFNTKTSKISHNINDVINWKDVSFHPEGLLNYLDFGYSVFGQTPIKNVRFLEHSSEIKCVKNKLIIKKKDDIAREKLRSTKYSSQELIALIAKKTNKWVNSNSSRVIIPTSGGYDSRLLNAVIKNKRKISSYTYGISKKQTDSFEVVYAKKLSEKLGIDWHFIKLGYYHKYFDEWEKIYGCSTHAHGMYHIEFFNKIKSKNKRDHLRLLSGIFGDVWAGGVKTKSIDSPEDLLSISYSHGINADSSYCKIRSKRPIRKKYFHDYFHELNDKKFQVIHLIRIKMMLISYLLRIPTELDFEVWSPFLDPDITVGMLNLPDEERKDRLWQQKYFKKNNLFFEEDNFKASKENSLNVQAIKLMPPKPLNVNLLSELFEKNYIEKINKNIKGQSFKTVFFNNINIYPKIESGLKKFNINNPQLNSYYAYLTLKPIENVLIKRNQTK